MILVFTPNFMNRMLFLLPLILLLVVWELIWKGMALWKSARLGQTAWFVALLLINSAGILPIIYLLVNREERKAL